MRTQIIGTVIAGVAAAALVSAQTPGQAGQPQAPGTLAPSYQQQLVTVEGCLHREGAPDEAARELAADPESNVVFVIVNAEVRSRIDTMPGEPGAAADDTVLGPAGLQNQRHGVPVEESAAVEPREAGQQPGGPGIEGAPTPARNRDRYVVVGIDGDRLRPLAGQRVAMTGQFEPPVAAVEQAADAGAVQDPGAGVDRQRPTGEVAAPAPVGTSGAIGSLLDLPRFQATSIKPVPGICLPMP